MIKLTTNIINFLFYFCFPILKGYKIIENLVKNNNEFLWFVSILYDSNINKCSKGSHATWWGIYTTSKSQNVFWSFDALNYIFFLKIKLIDIKRERYL
jgi:hypothetical protein